MSISFFLLGILMILSFLTSISFSHSILKIKNSPETILEGKTMGTYWRIRMIDVNKRRINELHSKIQSQLDEDNQLLSTYKKNSILMCFNQFHKTSPWPISKAMSKIITESLYIGHKTDGAMDITIGSLVNLWGFGPNEIPNRIPDRTEVNNLLRKVTGLRHLTIIDKSGKQYLRKDIPDLFIDLSTVGEGYAADHLADLMKKEKISRYLVSVGSAIVSCGMNSFGRPWRIAIKKPTDQQNSVQAIIHISGYGISTSGNYQNYYELNGKKFFHIIDPRTGYPITNNIASITVIAQTALEADAWDTGLMVLGPRRARETALKYGLAVYMIIKRDNNTFTSWISPRLAAFLAVQD